MDEVELPLFPLNTVLFPGGALQLKVFEARYLDMLSERLKSGRSFGIVLIRSGQEVGAAPSVLGVGTTARIADWQSTSNGLLLITVTGDYRFRIVATDVQENQLLICKARLLAADAPLPLPSQHQRMSELVERLMPHFPAYASLPQHRLKDAASIGYRLAEFLPIPLSQKQYLLELDDPLLRLDQLSAAIQSLIETE